MNRIVITGNKGFVGTHTQKALEEKGYEVVGFDLKDGFDIRKIEDLREVIKEGDKVLHLAAIAKFIDSDNDPELAFDTNVIGTKNVAQVCSEKGAERLIYSSTGSVYMPVDKEPPITEEFHKRGNSVYGCTKLFGEMQLKNTIKKVPYIIFRYAHLYGEGKIGHGAVGGFISRMERGLAPTLYGGKQSNDFTYIKDIVQANILALETDNQDNLNQAYNIGTGTELVTEEVFESMRNFFGYYKEFERLPVRSVDPLRLFFSIEKAREKLGYEPKFTFEQGLADYCEKK